MYEEAGANSELGHSTNRFTEREKQSHSAVSVRNHCCISQLCKSPQPSCYRMPLFIWPQFRALSDRSVSRGFAHAALTRVAAARMGEVPAQTEASSSSATLGPPERQHSALPFSCGSSLPLLTLSFLFITCSNKFNTYFGLCHLH